MKSDGLSLVHSHYLVFFYVYKTNHVIYGSKEIGTRKAFNIWKKVKYIFIDVVIVMLSNSHF
jgi:hypothetical protein